MIIYSISFMQPTRWCGKKSVQHKLCGNISHIYKWMYAAPLIYSRKSKMKWNGLCSECWCTIENTHTFERMLNFTCTFDVLHFPIMTLWFSLLNSLRSLLREKRFMNLNQFEKEQAKYMAEKAIHFAHCFGYSS